MPSAHHVPAEEERLRRFQCTTHSVPAQLCLTLRGPTDCSPSGSSLHGIFQARILGWASISSSRGSSQHRNGAQVSYIFLTGSGFFTTESPGKPIYIHTYICVFINSRTPLIISTEGRSLKKNNQKHRDL